MINMFKKIEEKWRKWIEIFIQRTGVHKIEILLLRICTINNSKDEINSR